jgi:Protein of unknown function (DUF4235)
MKKILYKPVGMLASALAGAVAGLLFKQAWRLIADERQTPGATDENRLWSEILIAAALQGAIFAVVKAAIDRGGAEGVRAITGQWPA